jgi:hypothetical protein
MNGGRDGGARVRQTPALATIARLLDLPSTATYLAVSTWTVRDLEAAGVLPRVRLPLADGGALRKLLFDRVDLDALIERWKDAAEAVRKPGGRP